METLQVVIVLFRKGMLKIVAFERGSMFEGTGARLVHADVRSHLRHGAASAAKRVQQVVHDGARGLEQRQRRRVIQTTDPTLMRTLSHLKKGKVV